ncbi:MAG: DUF5320 domain-containing protein [Dehalococcoidales bacterium]|nr:DUF5320 domain-containing protein [Dehalococcoidales bacterium]
MPGKDGTGPDGKGPMTGRGFGECVIPFNTPQEEIDFLKSRKKALEEQLQLVEDRLMALEATDRRSKK